MTGEEDYLALDDKSLLAQCDVNTTKASGPGGQHRNKVSSAIRMRHRPTGITSQGHDSRSQSDNKKLALQRMRMKIACERRRPVDTSPGAIPPLVRECIFTPRGGKRSAAMRMEIGRKDHRFWPAAAFLLDLLEASAGRLAEASAILDISTSNLTHILKSNRHLLAATQILRKRHGLKALM